MNRLPHFCTRCGKELKQNAKEIKFQSSGYEVTYTLCHKCKQVNVVEAWIPESRQLESSINEMRTMVVSKDTSLEGKAVIAEGILKMNEALRRITQFDTASMRSVNILAQQHNEKRTERKRK